MYRSLRASESDLSRLQNPPSASSSRHRAVKEELRRTDGVTQMPHLDNDNKPARRRIQLACVRCRKRKIKCSGEAADGSGCTNCKAANQKPCEFLRAYSTKCTFQTRPESGDVFLHPTITNTPATTSIQSPYNNQFSQSVPSVMSPMYPMPETTRSHSVPDMGQFASWPRGPYYGNSLFEDVYAVHYGPSSLSYIQPSSGSGSHAGFYGSPTTPKAWDTVTNMGSRYQLATFYTEADASHSSAQNIVLASSNRSSSVSNDVPSLFPTINLLSHSDGFTSRVLPTPTSELPQSSSNTASPGDPELLASGLPSIGGDIGGGNYPSKPSTFKLYRRKAVSDSAASGVPSSLPTLKQDASPQEYMSYLSTAPLTSPGFSRSGAAERHIDSEDSLVMSMGGAKSRPSNAGSYGYGRLVGYNSFNYMESSSTAHSVSEQPEY
ncbi:hypothetical protein BGW36DRAFT_45412 [Talaromyces proteolyticus]|uniref:Zn(2)-C6 fungal-type domain-containing protein n=1 Tax=Talaromyces proteolyticus TaxID=1131652 RepID=A0AAD4KHE8_9EURO|nr:uncharacterized protein BGW36DRAFT_45412 [Talaromyces proteolyticus]KAH8692403.1 hypothetical protein BGW36DRAFT_45412 [Talaromyces proteolyticus]